MEALDRWLSSGEFDVAQRIPEGIAKLNKCKGKSSAYSRLTANHCTA